MQHDPLNDAMSMIKNAETVGKANCTIRPYSNLAQGILEVMTESRYIVGYDKVEDNRGSQLEVKLNGAINDCGIIKPRFAVKRTDMEKYEERFLPAQDFGVLILTTTHGVISNNKAKELGIGGKLLAFVY